MEDKKMDELLGDWTALNTFLMRRASESDVEALLARERKGKNRKTIVARIHSRRNRCRYLRERRELGVGV